MDKIATRELYSQLQERLVIKLEENEILCPECKGLLFKYVESNGKAHIEACRRCYTGKLTVCKHCGKGNTSWCDCKEAYEERSNEYRSKQAQKNYKAYQKAKKISYKDYDGYYLFGNDEHLKDGDDLEEWIYEKLQDGEEVPEYMWAVECTPYVSIDLRDVIYNKCEDGYEDMYDHLNTNSPLLDQAQELINQWKKEQGDNLCVFSETYEKAIIIKDLVEEIRKEIQKD